MLRKFGGESGGNGAVQKHLRGLQKPPGSSSRAHAWRKLCAASAESIDAADSMMSRAPTFLPKAAPQLSGPASFIEAWGITLREFFEARALLAEATGYVDSACSLRGHLAPHTLCALTRRCTACLAVVCAPSSGGVLLSAVTLSITKRARATEAPAWASAAPSQAWTECEEAARCMCEMLMRERFGDPTLVTGDDKLWGQAVMIPPPRAKKPRAKLGTSSCEI